MNDIKKAIAVAYLARGSDINWLSSFEQFLNSYERHQAGCKHSLYVIYKGFKNSDDLEKAASLFTRIPHEPVYLGDDKFDLGAYIEWANMIEEDLICVLNTSSEILGPDWLYKLAVNLLLPNVGLVGATASYESLKELNRKFPGFPNIHIRTNAFMIDRVLFCNLTEGVRIGDKEDAWLLESGPRSLTRQVLEKGQEVLLVGNNGRAYSPKFWATSHIFRQGKQENLLVSDNQTKYFLSLPWSGKMILISSAWGNCINKVAPI